ncbi:chromosome partitioning protein ParA [bacterium (Candidatus Blackallbacteria) CG17_big_fil_post_rev_8_21_14_2_50_48_46]|uniref:Chromosome partitioning protein ParA n=1 Tax=bacterium (Candidatus Blackallbacteria) CG17_big_fil_post_rev_8_21_14_2_50_48_46 TaxID=2014261 RepID=A0A2M7G8U0_9BACT|nr:MAG: chromosome partitioning protein ParA [bacterium (Candidatus Blackallbacteria) CG18_big_fil_WC_8_21_14_2_50_49_26]PIW18507.1 MAG: chromosome partitioning protein ParA [bacterium (Candidatus Blackallbacteria) CG17_big_fil_post_rev_8_21_14_2_50_48_46]PIW46508.1 MAG: chromosome partitioning protein ParA [bacterium (Candidatus Blackallbacteria) CG13_big_fil_rev_8_21_14_2_50_49_14]
MAEKQAPKKTTKRATASKNVLSIDIGGSGLKLRVLDPQGQPLSERLRTETPQPADPEAVLNALAYLIDQVTQPYGYVSVGFPGVVRHGVIYTAVNLNPAWEGFNLAEVLEIRLKCPVRVANDADIQGYGAIQGKGLEMVLTLGTGMGAALFTNGHLVPNLELGHHPFRKGQTYEEQLGRAALDLVGKKTWNKRLLKAIDLLQRIFNFDTLYIGGGNAKRIDPGQLPPGVEIISNEAGILGGAVLWRDH